MSTDTAPLESLLNQMVNQAREWLAPPPMPQVVLRRSSQLLIKQLQQALGRGDREEIRWFIDRLTALSDKFQKSGSLEYREPAVIMIECALAAYQIQSYAEAVKFLESAMKFCEEGAVLHFEAVIRSMLGCIQWRLPQQEDDAIVSWEKSIEIYQNLQQLYTGAHLSGQLLGWYADRINDINSILELALELADPPQPSSPPRSEAPTPDERVVILEDELSYSVENQSWYIAEFSPTIEVDLRQITTLQDKIDVVLITATEEEIKAVIGLLKPYPSRKKILKTFVGPETYYLGKFGECRAVVTKCRIGATGEGSVILATEQAQRIWRPKAVIMVGIAFGRDPQKQAVADVMVASQVISYEQQRVGDRVIPHGPITPSNAVLLNRFTNVPNWHFTRPDGKVCKIHIGAILSGEKLVDDPKFKADLFDKYPQAIGGEMEGAGLCAASGRMGVPWILIKAISDWGDGRKHNKHQPLATAAATSLVHYVLSQKAVLNSINKPTS